MSNNILSDKTRDQIDLVSDMITKHIEDSGCRLLTIHYAIGPGGKDDNGHYLPGRGLLLPKFTSATTYDLIMFREQFNVLIDGLIKESLDINDITNDG